MLLPLGLCAQIWPKEGSKLNYRIIGFSCPPESGANKYVIEIAPGKFFSADSFKRKIAVRAESKEPKMVAEVPEFGADYTWRVVYSGGKAKESGLYHFSTMTTPNVDTSKMRLRIVDPAVQFKDAYVIVDRGGVMYDMNGRAVWFIPDPEGGAVGNAGDIKFTKDGSITFIYGYSVEMDYNGRILWKTPKKGTVRNDSLRGEIYHHEFVKMSNGHYMALALEMMYCKTITEHDSSYIVYTVDDNVAGQNGYLPAKFGCLIEYDEKGNVVWIWKSMDYLLKGDLAYYNPVDQNMRFDAHDNAFFFDEINKAVYVGFKNIGRIIKIEYPSGKVVQEYGDIFKPGVKEMGRGLFCGQHSINRTEDGYLCVYNNNTCNPGKMPQVLLLQEPVSRADTITKTWEFICPVPDRHVGGYYQGGNAIPLPGRNVFGNLGSQYSKLFIASRDKKILWSALPERFVETDEKWVPNYQYRSNIISRKELERFIWAAEKHGEK